MFLGIIIEEALILSLLGFIAGVLVSIALYKIVAFATDLPMEMTFSRAPAVMLAMILTCLVSGAIATRRLAKTNPADLF